MIAQYLEIKRAHPDCLLFYRMGDFYELFFEDAVKAAAALDIQLTKRGRIEGDNIPMCGVPVHSSESYLAKLIREGFRVAVCEQMENPAEAKKRGNKGPMKRAVIRIVTPGTLTEDNLLDTRRHNYLMAIAEAAGELALAWLDLSTGEVSLQAVAGSGLANALSRLEPGEILVPQRLLEAPDFFELWGEWKQVLTPLPSTRFDSENGRKRLQETYRVASLEGFGNFTRAEIAAAGALVDYVALTQQGKIPALARPRRFTPGAVMEIDAATRRNLELTQSLSGERRGSLLATIDRTVTGAGARLLAEYLASPLTDPKAIAARLDAVQFFLEDPALAEAIRAVLKGCPDMARAMARLTLGRGGPRDLASIRDTLRQTDTLHQLLRDKARGKAPALIEAAHGDLGDHGPLVKVLSDALVSELPLLARDGGFIAPNFAPEIDMRRQERDEARRNIANLQSQYVAKTGIAGLKVKHNGVLGYFIEVTPVQASKLNDEFIHRQTLANQVRYSTVELTDFNASVATTSQQVLSLEIDYFEKFVKMIVERAEPIACAARALAVLDATSSLAEIARNESWCRPVIDDGDGFAITGGRHPVVEAALKSARADAFVGNDCDLAQGQRLWLVTGPNMAGKSTFLRQNAIIALLAQIGSFVPAERATIGIVDRLFSRVGAGDDLARGRSTFMVEMVETAAILNQAGPKALVILDEIGRGTATFDGLSIAWAVIEHLHDANRCRALFATHYHELTALAAKLPALSCHTMRVKEWGGDVIFLHQVGPGAADRSYGIHVAKLAGLPASVVTRAEGVLATLEQGEQGGALTRLADDLPLFQAGVKPASAPPPSPLEEALAAIRPDELSPKDALELLYRLKSLGGH